MSATRSVQRALRLLRLMNEQRIWTLAELAQRMELPKTTVHRMLQTLQAEHYVRSDEGMHGIYQLTHQVLDLSWGVTDHCLLVDAAAKILITTTRDTKWPLSLGMIEGHNVRVRFCAMPYSPYAIRPTSYGRQYSLLTSALGKTYLACCTPPERRLLIDMLRAQDAWPQTTDARWLRATLRSVRQQGFGTRLARTRDESDACAVPIHAGRQLLGVLAFSTFAGMLNDAWLQRHVPILQQTAQRVGQEFLALERTHASATHPVIGDAS